MKTLTFLVLLLVTLSVSLIQQKGKAVASQLLLQEQGSVQLGESEVAVSFSDDLYNSHCSSGSIQNNVAQIVQNSMALDELIACGSAAIPFILESLPRETRNVNTPERSILLLAALSETGSQSAEAEATLIEILETNSVLRREFDSRSDVEDFLLSTFEAIVRTSTLQRIAQNSSISGELRYWTARELIRRDEHNAAIPALISILSSTNDSESLRNSVAFTLGRLGQVEAVPTLIDIVLSEASSDPNKTVCANRDALGLIREIDSRAADRTRREIEQRGGIVVECSPHPPPAADSAVRSETVERLASSRPAICRIAAFRSAFPGVCY